MSDVSQLPRLVSTGRATEFLGISYHTLRQIIHSGEINVVRVKNRYFIPREELEKLLRTAA